jgi:hypothetical protein
MSGSSKYAFRLKETSGMIRELKIKHGQACKSLLRTYVSRKPTVRLLHKKIMEDCENASLNFSAVSIW